MLYTGRLLIHVIFLTDPLNALCNLVPGSHSLHFRIGFENDKQPSYLNVFVLFLNSFVAGSRW